MTVTTLSSNAQAVLVEVPVESPEDAIDLVFELVDLGEPVLTHDTMLDHLGTLGRGFGCNDDNPPRQFLAIVAQAWNDTEFTLSTNAFVDVLWDLRQLVCPDVAAA